MLKRLLGPTYPIFIFFLTNLVILSVSRLGLALWQSDRVAAVDGWIPLFLQGVRIDVSALCWLFSIAIVMSCFFVNHSAFGRAVQFFVRLWLTLGSTFIVFMEFATPAFIETYDFRPNRLFIEYLVNPKEVFTMLWNGHLVALISAPILTALFAFFFWKLAGKASRNLHFPNWKYRPVLFLVLGVITFLGARSSFASFRECLMTNILIPIISKVLQVSYNVSPF